MGPRFLAACFASGAPDGCLVVREAKYASWLAKIELSPGSAPLINASAETTPWMTNAKSSHRQSNYRAVGTTSTRCGFISSEFRTAESSSIIFFIRSS